MVPGLAFIERCGKSAGSDRDAHSGQPLHRRVVLRPDLFSELVGRPAPFAARVANGLAIEIAQLGRGANFPRLGDQGLLGPQRLDCVYYPRRHAWGRLDHSMDAKTPDRLPRAANRGVTKIVGRDWVDRVHRISSVLPTNTADEA